MAEQEPNSENSQEEKPLTLRQCFGAFLPPKDAEGLLGFGQFIKLTDEEKLAYLHSLSSEELLRLVAEAYSLP